MKEEEQTNEIVKSDYCALPAVSWGCTTMQCGMQSFSDDNKSRKRRNRQWSVSGKEKQQKLNASNYNGKSKYDERIILN